MEQIVEGIKHKVPIWKKEIMEDKSVHWVQE
jgi:molybdopterin synthase catalytic subunit